MTRRQLTAMHAVSLTVEVACIPLGVWVVTLDDPPPILSLGLPPWAAGIVWAATGAIAATLRIRMIREARRG